ncbi:MAG TPA: hypothetical protein VE222_01875 [Nitrospiraceae bacterium]|jgi:hypothetical protein|nr:hypothetical protein [Nitrospiraceae bacterium]
MRRVFGTIGVTVFLWIIPAMLESAEQREAGLPPSGYALPEEPDEFDRREVAAYYDWRNNMFFRVFKLASQESKPDFMTARRTYKASVNQDGYEVAVTFAHPLFYWVDLNGNGEFEPDKGEMWIDVEEDGVNGNERLYDPMTPGEGPRGPVPMPPAPTGRSGQPL